MNKRSDLSVILNPGETKPRQLELSDEKMQNVKTPKIPGLNLEKLVSKDKKTIEFNQGGS